MAAGSLQGRKQQTNEHFTRADELMSAALDLFAERDFASVTIKDSAHAIGVNTALIYYYFESNNKSGWGGADVAVACIAGVWS